MLATLEIQHTLIEQIKVAQNEDKEIQKMLKEETSYFTKDEQGRIRLRVA